jgi:hypothetical protein
MSSREGPPASERSTAPKDTRSQKSTELEGSAEPEDIVDTYRCPRPQRVSWPLRGKGNN